MAVGLRPSRVPPEPDDRWNARRPYYLPPIALQHDELATHRRGLVIGQAAIAGDCQRSRRVGDDPAIRRGLVDEWRGHRGQLDDRLGRLPRRRDWSEVFASWP